MDENRGTALHMAVNFGETRIVEALVDAIMAYNGESALKLRNRRGNTALHIAALRGFTRMCRCIIGEKGERKDLIKVKNDLGETPLFLAALACHNHTFVYLHNASKDSGVSPAINDNHNNTILHNAIADEVFIKQSNPLLFISLFLY
ncbi:hypothetical protein RJT34_00432 [Clitoria ternatea]|uniref:Ankyrin repeat protein n=1 Tax=Clitoria ternatea TaxID=43366 RepID=A0AAN9KIF0_CLITE